MKGPEDTWARAVPRNILVPRLGDREPHNVIRIGWVWEWQFQDACCVWKDGKPKRVTYGDDGDPD